MTRFVAATGLISIVSGAALQVPAVAALLLPGERAGMLTHLFGAMAMVLGVMLMLCARNLPARAPLVMWEGVLRLCGCCVMAGYGLAGGGAGLVAGGLFDLLVGVAYLVLLPRHLGRSAIDLLLDRAP